MSELEPNNNQGMNYYDRELLYSIAISLKRIADKLELTQKQPIVMNAQEYENYLAAKERYEIGKAAVQKAADGLIKR